MEINRSWIALPGAYVAVDCITAFMPEGTGTVLFLKGGHTVDVPMDVEDIKATILSTNTGGDR